MESKSSIGGMIIAAFLIGMTVGAVLLAKLPHHGCDGKWRREIIDHNVAEWRCDPATGVREFHWLVDEEDDDG